MKSLFLVALVLLFAGCASTSEMSKTANSWTSNILPKTETHNYGPWKSYEEAEKYINSLKPYQSTRDEVKKSGLDPYKEGSVVTIIDHTSIIARFASGSAVQFEYLDKGIQDCIKLQKRCSGYGINTGHSNTTRTGNFLLDWTNFQKETNATGWSASALIVFVQEHDVPSADDKVVYSLISGQPRINNYSKSTNPLGPLQETGGRALGTLIPF